MKVREDREGDIVVLEPQGRIDSTTAPLLGERLTAVLTVLLLAAKHAEAAGRRLVLCGIKGKVRQLFDLSGFLDLLPLYASREESLASFR